MIQKYLITIETESLEENEDISKDLNDELSDFADSIQSYIKVNKL